MKTAIEVSEVWQNTFAIGHGRRVTISQDVGSITLGAWDRPETKVVATKRASGPDEASARRALGGLRVRANPGGRGLSIEVGGAARGAFGFSRPGRVDLDVTVPRGLDVDVDTGSGAVLAEELSGRLAIDTGAGPVTVARCAGKVTVDTGSGPVDVRETSGEVEVDTGSGTVNIDRVRGDVDVDTGNGSVRLRGVRARRIHVDTGRGEISGAFVPVRDGDYDFDTGLGSIELRVPAQAAGRFDLEADGGAIHCHLPLVREETRPGILRGVLKRGSCEVKGRAGRGDITVVAVSEADLGEETADWRAADPVDTGPDQGPGPGPSGRRGLSMEDEDYVRVLKMVEARRLTPEAAEQLLRALEEDDEADERPF
ncbi:MAG TPA: DUF4097 family beta strand repeat-containing protein [Bacillota bacterium]|jgi:hypothetical protein